MTQEQVQKLLQPRYLVIAPNGYHYPNSPFLDGEILVQQSKGIWLVHTKDGINSFHDRHPENYPNLFRKLEWWEEREIADMPSFLKDTADGEIYKVSSYENKDMVVIIPNKGFGDLRYTNISHFLPASYEQFESYKQQNK